MSESFWRVYVEFSVGNMDSIEKAIRHAVPREPDFSGGGMGRRDLGWHCRTEFEAQGIARKVRAIGQEPVVREITR